MAPTLQSDTRCEVKSRRHLKHLTERKRRARINDSLLQLKTIVFPAVKHEVGQSSKLEKADILDMTLRYVKDVQQKFREGKEPSVDQFQAGFSECFGQVSTFLGSCDTLPLETRRRLLTHLSNRSLTVDSAHTARQTSPQPTPNPTQMVQHSPERHVTTPQAIPTHRVVYLVPAHAIQPVTQTTVLSQTPSPPQMPPTVVSFLPTPPNSPSSSAHNSPTNLVSTSMVYQTILPEPTALVKRCIVPMATKSSPVSSAQDDSAVWRPW